MDHNNVSGLLPEVFSNLYSLSFSELSHNSFGGSIPSYWSDLTNLEHLNLRFLWFTSFILPVVSTVDALDTRWILMAGVEGKDSGDSGGTMVCVHCGNSVRSVYVEYSPGNIRLSTCARCQSRVDEYVEYESMIIVINVILHKPEVYRHLFFNYPQLHHTNLLNLASKATLLFLLLDTCRCVLQGVGNEKLIQWDSFTSFLFTAGQVVAQVILLNLTFLIVIIMVSHGWPSRWPNASIKLSEILLAVVLSSHFKLLVFAMMVWEFSRSMAFMVDMLVFTSNIIALKVMLNTTTRHAATAVISGAFVKFFMGALLELSGFDIFK